MKILLLGIETSVLDEGAKNVATNLARTLGQKNELLVIHQRKALSFSNVIKAMRFRPDIVLSVHGPSPKTVALLFTLRLLCGFAKSVIIGTQPHNSGTMLWLLRLLKPSLVFAQSRKWHLRFCRIGLKVFMLPNGVDLQKFSPCYDNNVIVSTRKQLGVQGSDNVTLHIGPINSNRNHELLARIRRETSWQVVVIGSTTEHCLPELVTMLEQAGVKVRVEYFPHINHVYTAADIYIFPVMDETGSIEFPLTVLEAMACDRPVAAYPFRGLPDFLPQTETLRYFHTFEELRDLLPELTGKSGNRQASLAFSWDVVAEQFQTLVKSELGVA